MPSTRSVDGVHFLDDTGNAGRHGSGETFLTSVLGLSAFRNDYSVRYFRTHLFYQLTPCHQRFRIPPCSPAWLNSTCSSWMTGCVTPFPRPIPRSCSKSLTTVMAASPPWSLLRSPCQIGLRVSRTRPSAMESWIRFNHNAYRLNLEGEWQRKTPAAALMSST
jgi:hypothetical protein